MSDIFILFPCEEYTLTSEQGTSSVSIFSFNHKAKTIHLIDTPGFNDTERSESEVLQEIAYWLSTAYGKVDAQPESRFRLNGIIYLHSVADVRWSGSTRRSFNMLRTICGPENYDAIVLTTTFWDQIEKATGSAREKQLLNDMDKWGQLVHQSPRSLVRRHDQGYKTAIGIIDLIVTQNMKYELLIQKELAQPGATIYQTTAGREAQMVWEKDIERFQEELAQVRDAFDASHQRSDTVFATAVKNLNSSIHERKSALDDLLLPKQELEERWLSRNSREVDLLQQKIVECHSTIDDLLRRSRSSSSTLSAPSNGKDVYEQWPRQGNHELTPSSSSVESLLLAQERRRQKDLTAQKMAKLAARSFHTSVAGSIFGGVSAGVALLPLLPLITPCSVM
ncbi:MAG: hypothetical protein Q9227_000539 [Pyrenula ochraceoflavens]